MFPTEEEFKDYLGMANNVEQSTGIEFEEEQSEGYRERTIKNASADATIAFAIDFTTAGEKLTKGAVEE